jgi:cell wall-associated NlpC family hydrolase
MPRRATRILAVVLAVGALGWAAVVGLMFVAATQVPGGSGGTEGSEGDSGAQPCISAVTGLGRVKGLDTDQLANARTIIATGATLKVPDRAVVVALATAMQESTLRNLHYGDRDSVGLFQQRPSAGWGSVAELTTPATAARKFYAALLRVPGWRSMPLTLAAQRVQRSAFPFAYAKWEPLATALVSATGGGIADLTCSTSLGYGSGTGSIGTMLQSALAQQGKPYVWGATGPDAFDCSGLVVYAWRMAGFRAGVRTSEQMFAASEAVPFGQEQPGDLVYGHFGSAGPGHVMIVVRPGVAVEAPSTGDVVKVIPYTSAGGWILGRLRPGVLQPVPNTP